MNIDDVIVYCKEKAAENEEQYRKHPNQLGYREEFYDCQECADNYRQVAEWLAKLKVYEEAIPKIVDAAWDHTFRFDGDTESMTYKICALDRVLEILRGEEK